MSGRPPRSPRWLLKLSVMALAHVLALWLLWRGWVAAEPWQIPLGLLAGHLALDMVTLFVHWSIDNYFSVRTPLLGPVVFYFREHHRTPLAMFERGVVDSNFEQAFICLTGEALAFAVDAGPLFDLCIGMGSLAGCYITQIHKWAHVSQPGPLPATLQRLRLIVDRRHHALHHAGNPVHYSLYSGWVGELFERGGVLTALEALIERCTGVLPVHRKEGLLGQRGTGPER